MEADKIIIDEVAEETKPNEDVLKALQEAIKGFTRVFGSYMAKLPTNKPSKHQMSKRGAVHTHRPTFKSRQILPMTPAQYRHFHFGASQKETK